MRNHINFIYIVLIILFCCINSSQTRIEADIIIKNALIITSVKKNSVIKNGTIIIKNSRIIDIDKSDKINYKYFSKNTIDGTNKLVIPGLINTHTHAAMSIFRGVADDMPLKEWLIKYIFPLEEKTVNAELVRIGTELAIAEMIHSGTTTF